MGYAIDAEYTLELLNEPRAYEYVAQRFVCTGFILAARVDEDVLSAIMRSWREIDEVTSDRLRFLFFVDNQTTLTGYPSHPHFTESGFKRHNQPFVSEADRASFKLTVRPGHQRAHSLDGGPPKDWHPEQRVRRRAQSLGISSLLPCLVWVHNHPNFFHIDYGIRHILYQHRDAFVDWRYIHEPKSTMFERSAFEATLVMMLREFDKRYRVERVTPF